MLLRHSQQSYKIYDTHFNLYNKKEEFEFRSLPKDNSAVSIVFCMNDPINALNIPTRQSRKAKSGCSSPAALTRPRNAVSDRAPSLQRAPRPVFPALQKHIYAKNVYNFHRETNPFLLHSKFYRLYSIGQRFDKRVARGCSLDEISFLRITGTFYAEKVSCMNISNQIRRRLCAFQKNEITEHHIYQRLAAHTKCPENRKVLEGIAGDELRHYNEWKSYTQKDVEPSRLKIQWYYLISRIFGLTFGVKLMERGEESAQVMYNVIATEIPQAKNIADDESNHEDSLLQMLDEERLRYTGSMVLGLNDALVELTGALAGFTLALQDTRLVALTGSITGFAAAFSMAASEYLSTKSEESDKKPLKAALYTGTAYVLTVIVLILPYLLLANPFVCLGCTLLSAIFIIAIFNFYIAVAKGLNFKNRFFEMAGLSLGIALLSFFIGYLLRMFIGVEI